LTTILFSISVVCATRSAKILGGTEANFWRLFVATILLGIWAHLFGQGLSGDSFPLFLWSGIIGVGADVFLFQALPRIGSRLSLLIVQCFSALSAATVEWLWMGTRLTAGQIAACITILGGVALALAPGKHLNATRQTLIAGICFGLLAAFGNGMGAVLSRKAYQIAREAHQNIDGATGGYQRLIGGLLVAAICLLIVRRREVAAQFTDAQAPKMPSAAKWRKAWPWVLANSFAGQTLGVTCYQWALKTTPTGLVLAVIAITPLVVIPFAHWVEGEAVEARSIVGGVVAVSGAVLLMFLS
ncbi:MAG TPA: DMT family transporter, partial [Candidatus Saccharimonadales bacterium]|nr:DMT family transporter [Candidatus Saccharimonadales bacterium]